MLGGMAYGTRLLEAGAAGAPAPLGKCTRSYTTSPVCGSLAKCEVTTSRGLSKLLRPSCEVVETQIRPVSPRVSRVHPGARQPSVRQGLRRLRPGRGRSPRWG